jgi:hypothetical protein
MGRHRHRRHRSDCRLARHLPEPPCASAVDYLECAGILDLILAVTMGSICGVDGSIALAPGEVTTPLMGQFRLSLIPTFIVPVLLIFHLIVLAKIANPRNR